MSNLEDLVRKNPLPSWRIAAWPIMLVLGALVGWAYFAELDEVSIAPGEVVPLGSNRVIQHLEGGIIKAIHVREGDTVEADQILLQLDLAMGGVNREELQLRLDNQMLVRSRLEVEADGGEEIRLPEDIAARRPAQAVAEERAFAARKRQLDTKLNVLTGVATQRELEVAELEARMRALEQRKRDIDSPAGSLRQQVRQKELEIKELEAQRVAVRNNLRLASERLSMSERLLVDGLVPKMEHLQLEGEVRSLEGELASLNQSIPRGRAAVAEVLGVLAEQVDVIEDEIEALTPAIPRARAAVAEALERAREEETRFRREAQEELGRTEQAVARIRELLSEAIRQTVRAGVRSPIEGVVKNLRYHTIGGVVQPGEAIMEIVPTGERLVVEARLNPTDRGYVAPGQPTVVKVSTYDYARYGGLDGRVTMVAPDSSTDENGIPFFRVLVETERTYLGEADGQLPIVPGMEATVDIHTGKKTVIEYLIKPVLKLRHEAFRER